MGKNFYLNRYFLIIKRLEKGPAAYSQIEEYLFHTPEFQDDQQQTYSIRTFQRDIKDIQKFFNIEIVNERKGDKRYYIAGRPEMEIGERNQVFLESYQIINCMNQYPDFADYVFLEARQPRGVHHFYNLLHAIKARRIITFDHYKYLKTEITRRKVQPLALKESKNRWYLIALDSKDGKLKTFGLDRLDNIEMLKTGFKKTAGLNVRDYFSHSFGVISSETLRPEEIIIRSNKDQAEYIKSFPLHASQMTKEESGQHVIFKLSLCITYDFIQELLSYGKNVEVLSPLKLRNKMAAIIKETLQLYQS
jgi:proteasome accessory factor B